jgi:CBS domain-containing protein
MRVSRVMTSPVSTIDPATELVVARELMEASNFHHLVVAQGGTTLGVISDRDVIRSRPKLYDDVWRVRDVMTEGVVSVSADSSIAEAARLMRERNIHCLLVMRGDEVGGIVTATDLLKVLEVAPDGRTAS